MALSISNESIEELKNRVNIVDVIGRDVRLKRAGSNFKGLCPFHNEKTPSFVVSESKQYFTCFGCGARGDVIEYVKKQYNLEFVEAVQKLADENGIKLEEKSSYNDKQRTRYYEINRMAAQYFYDALTKGANEGIKYLEMREISKATIKKFGLGYADKEWTSLHDYLSVKGVRDEEMRDLGLISIKGNKKYDKFRNRVMFPIINTSGKVIGFGGRAIDKEDSPKYLNSPENSVFKKKNNLYGLNLARKSAGKEGFIILVEGYMDVISLSQSGVENAVASLGTALTENQAKLLHRYTGDVILSYDADKAGRNAASRGMDILRDEECRVRVLHVPDGKDPDEYVKKHGKEGFIALLDTAMPYGDYKLESAKEGFDLSKDDDKIRYIKKVSRILASMEPVEQELYTDKLAAELGVSSSSIKLEIVKFEGDDKGERKPARVTEEEEKPSWILPREVILIKIITASPGHLDKLVENKGIIESDLARRIMNDLYKMREKTGTIDLNEELDRLSEQDRAKLAEELGNTVISESSIDDTYNELIRSWKKDDLSAREKDILKSLSLADDETSGEQIKLLQNELISIRNEINKLK